MGQQPLSTPSGTEPTAPASAYQPYAPQYGYRRPKTNTLSILALVFAFVLSPLGIAFGFAARARIHRTGEDGAGLALAGIIIGFAVMFLAVIGTAFLFWLFAAWGNST